MIVKHRRGTTLEWQDINLDLIPEAGELVIEECIDGSRRCKVGTGYTRFSDLPYIDDKTRSDLLTEIASAKKQCKNQIAALNEELITELTTLEAELSTIETKCHMLEEDYIIRDADIVAILGANLQNAIKELESKIDLVSDNADDTQTDLQEKTDRIEQLIMAAENRFDTNLKDSSDEIKAELYDIIDEYKASDDDVKATLRRELAAVSSTLTASYDEMCYDVADKLTDFETQIDITKDKANAALRSISKLIAPSAEAAPNAEEVKNIRSGYDGTAYQTAGDAVRAIGYDLVTVDNKVENLKNDLSQYIGSKAVTGLHYDINGNVGQCKPYTLYLTAGQEVLSNSGVQVLGGSGGGPGSGGSGYLEITYEIPETSDLDIRLGNKYDIVFNFSGKDSSGDTVAQATAEWSLDGVNIANTTVRRGLNRFSVTDYLSNEAGEHTLFLTVTDANQSFVTKTWYINVIELSVTADTLDDKQSFTAGERLTFSYKPSGAIDKTAIIKLDDNVIHTEFLSANKSGDSIPYELPALTHGAHLLEIYLTADFDGDGIIDDSEYSNHVLKDLIFIDSSDSRPVIGIAERDFVVEQYSTTNLVYTVYSPDSNPVVDIYVDNEKVSTTTITPNKDYKNTPTAVYPYFANTDGKHEVKLVCGETEKIIKIDVTKVDADIAPITTGLAFDFNPVGRNNGDLTHRNWKYDNITMTVSDNFDWINGGYKPDDPDGPCFCIKAGSTATINYKPFQEEARVNGREVKIIFKTKNISNPDAIFLSCIDNRTTTDHVGVTMGAHAAHIYGKTGNLELAYSEEDVIELEFNISAAGDNMQMVMGYEDGVPSRPMMCTNSTSFKQATPKNITLGSPDCDLYIYRFKVYKTSLSADAVLKNYIADARTGEEMISRYNNNKIYNAAGNLTPESLAEACPWLRVYKIEAPLFTTSKDDKVDGTTIQQIYKNGDPILDNWTCYNAQHSGQGTSSNNYGAAGRNLDFIMNKEKSYFILGDGRTQAKSISLTRESVPVAYLNAKVNIASSNNLTNALIAKRYNEFNPYKRPFVERPIPNRAYTRDAENNVVEIKTATPVEHVKDTMEFYNCAIFIRETARDFSTHSEFADDKWHFYAIGNIGDSKKTDSTRATDPNDPLECCVEIMDVGLPLSAFPRDTMMNAMQLAKDELGNIIPGDYVWANEENRDILYEASYIEVDTDTAIDLNKTYYYEEAGKMVSAMEFAWRETRDYLFAKDENIDKLFEIAFIQTQDTEILPDKIYYVELEGAKVNAWEYYTVSEETGEYIYTYLTVDNLKNLFEAEFNKTDDTTVDLSKTYYYEEFDADGNFVKMSNAMGYTTVLTKYYPKLEDGTKLYERVYTLTTGAIDPENKIYYVDILEHDDFSEDYTYGWRYSANKKDTAITGPCKQAWINFYRFVTNSTDEEFKQHFDKYFVKDSALYYYLFTTRYCMVDNRAKNTFWHYSKTGGVYENDIEIKNANGDILFSAVAGEPIRKWDLCWDYDNDTSLGLNNYGKQAYRYGFEDTDYEEGSGIEIFRQSDSTFFCRVRDLFASELKTMYNTLDGKNAWSASAFINEGDAWQNQFPEALWYTDIERKYIRSYKVDPQFLVNMANGKMKYHRRQWERSQEQYMASKYQTASSLDAAKQAANFRVNTKAVTNNSSVPANHSFELTPYSHIYLNVKYGGTSPVAVRAKPNEKVSIPYYGDTPDIINIGSAAAISDFGDLSLIYPYTASVQNATKIKKLKLGNDTEGYINTYFTTFATGENALLEELDLTNVQGFNAPLELDNLINLKTLKAKGTRIPSVNFATGGKISDIRLPAVTELSLISLSNLITDKIDLASYESIADLTITDCPNVDQLTILERCTGLTRAKLDNVNFGTKTYQYFIDNIFDLQGIDGGTIKELEVDGEIIETTNAQISGTVNFESLTGEQFNTIKTRYPNLIITYNALTSVIKFMDTDRTTVLTPEESQRYTRNSENKIDCIALGIVPDEVTAKTASAEFSYTLFGWSTDPDEPAINYEYLEDGEAILAEEAARKKYNIDMLTNIEGDRVFYPVFKATRLDYLVQFKDIDGELLKELPIPYGSLVPENEYNSLRQKDTPSYDAPGISVFVGWIPKPEETVITKDTVFSAQYVEDELTLTDIGASNYSLTNGVILITGCQNKLNDAIKIPASYKINGKDYPVVSIGGFGNEAIMNAYTNLEVIKLPETLYQLTQYAFAKCIHLKEIEIPSNITQIPGWAFADCTDLAKVTLNGAVTTLGATCFYKCTSLSEINLDEGLTTILTYVFYQTALKDVVIPSTVETIGERAFGNIANLSTITLRSRLLLDVEKFDYRAFAESGTEEIPLIINVPWTELEHYSTFGGTDSNGNYYKVEVDKDNLTGEPVYGDGKFKAAYAKVICSDTPDEEEITNV